jgi:DMSO/TMAO reductase YedYZ heme-binding membrane subunit
VSTITGGHLWWYVARSGGFVAWGLLAASMVWGLALSTKAFGRRPRPSWLLDLHRFFGAAALVFTGIHVGGLLLDNYVHFGLSEVLVPLASHWHPLAVAWGVVGLYLLLAVEVTSLLRKHMPNRLWRRVHFLSFPLFVGTTIHALSAGTDRQAPFMLLGLLAGITGVSALAAVRFSYEKNDSGNRPRSRPTTRPPAAIHNGSQPQRSPRAPASRPRANAAIPSGSVYTHTAAPAKPMAKRLQT